jgi:hypothetical protein
MRFRTAPQQHSLARRRGEQHGQPGAKWQIWHGTLDDVCV